MKYKLFVIFGIVSMMLFGCVGDDTDKEPETDNTEKIKVDVSLDGLPLDVKELYQENEGSIEGFDELSSEEKDNVLKDINKNDYSYLLDLVQVKYESPEETLNKLKYSLGEFKGSDRYVFKDNLNILILLDASGSMGKILNGETQMNIAKKSLTEFMGSLPSEANVGLRVYGHKGKGIEADKELSCSSSELVYGMSPYVENEFKGALSQVHPSGWTPTDLALQKASEDLKGKLSADNTNIIYLVSDGISTCNDNPVDTAKKLYESDLSPVINIIGFNVDSAAKEQLIDVAKVTKGVYTDVNNSAALTKEFKEVEKVANEWKVWLDSLDKELEADSKVNLVEIYNYAARLQQKIVEVDNKITDILSYAEENELIKEEKLAELKAYNESYIKEMTANTGKLREDLRSINNTNLKDTLSKVEELIYGK